MNIKKYIKRKFPRQSGDGAGGQEKIIQLYENKIKPLAKIKIKRSVWITLGIVLLAIAVLVGIQLHVYRDYQVLSSAENEDTQSAGYTQLGDGLLKYGDDGAYLLSQSQEIVWNQTYEMSNPDSDVRGEYTVI